MVSGWPLLYWIDHSSGDANYLDRSAFRAGAGWTGSRADPLRQRWSERLRLRLNISLSGLGQRDAGENNHPILYVNLYQPTRKSIGVLRQRHPGSTGKDLLSLMSAFTVSDNPSFDASIYNCGRGRDARNLNRSGVRAEFKIRWAGQQCLIRTRWAPLRGALAVACLDA